MFTGNDIRERLRQRPFTPIRLITSSGDHYDIYHPDLVMVGKRQVIVGTASEDNPTDFDRFSLVSLLHITAVENLSPSEATKNRS
jgi:hypothetical protein